MNLGSGGGVWTQGVDIDVNAGCEFGLLDMGCGCGLWTGDVDSV